MGNPQDPKIDPAKVRYVDVDFDSSRRPIPDYLAGPARLNKPDVPQGWEGLGATLNRPPTRPEIAADIDPSPQSSISFGMGSEGCSTEAPRRLFTPEQLKADEADKRHALHHRVAEFMMLPNSENEREVDRAIFAYREAWMIGRRRVIMD